MFARPIINLRLVFLFALFCLIALTVTFRSRASEQPLRAAFNGGGPDILWIRGGMSSVTRRVTPDSLRSAFGVTHPLGGDTPKVNSPSTPAPTLGNYPDISVPLSTNTTVAPSAAPTNTTSINASTSINFKGKLEADPATGSVRVTDAHPAGTYTVTLTAFNGSGGPTTTQTLTLAVTTPATCDPVSFAAATFEAGERVGLNLVGDFNGDGKQDLAVGAVATDYSSQRTIILLGDGAGSFSYVSDVPVGARAVVDFNGDGKQDLIALDSGNAVLYAGDGTGHFTVFNNVDTGCTSPFQLAVGDFNGDGKIDLVTACYFVDGVTIMLGDGAGGFGTPASFGVSDGPQGLAVGDFNNDGKQDLAVACMPAGVVSILLGDGAGGFSAPTDFNAGATPRDVEVGDFNGDGKQDLAVSNPSTNAASVMLGNGLGGFGAPASFAVGTDPETIIAVGDFNGDGKQDLAVPNFGSANVSILLGDGAGGFGSATNFDVGLSPFGVVVGDFNGDGMEDLATANWDSNNTSILLRDCTTASVATPEGANVSVQAGTATVHFANVSTSGTTTFEPIDPSSAGSLPAGFTLCTSCPAYDISTTAVYTAPLTICLAVPPNITQQVYSTLKLMHGEDGTLVDRTTAHFADGEGQRWVCGSVNSLSPFVLAQGLSPTAAEGQVVGHIVDSQGNAIDGVGISMDGVESRATITDREGTYRFDRVQANGFYTVTPARANYSFTPASRSFSSLGVRTEASFTATFHGDNTNAIDASEYFVRQQYLDFLGREPDESGFNFWSDQILSCGSDAACIERRTINVSAAYFLSIEFQQTGGLVDGLYRASYGRAPSYGEFIPDTAAVARGVVVGDGDWAGLLATNKQAFIDAWVQRPDFQSAYGGLTNSAFVDTLLSHTAGFNGNRETLVSGLNNGSLTRSAVLRQVVENEGFIQAKRNAAFVMMQYFGYLRRDPDASGYQFWLNKLNQFDGNFEQAEMVKAFIVSGEYRQRFGP